MPVELLVKAYSPTKKYPPLAVARCPEQVSRVFAALRDTLAALCACMDDDEEEEAITGMGALTTRLEHLEKRTCSRSLRNAARSRPMTWPAPSSLIRKSPSPPGRLWRA
ncbi:hypothetical protein [Streptomyces noursei]|uniref:hypothetical protein n=1 Tax=Streptomyces noursei TaxID=1971 RepID=UPI0023B80AF5|nr:hypothetical protein [Streptomyces noursei]